MFFKQFLTSVFVCRRDYREPASSSKRSTSDMESSRNNNSHYHSRHHNNSSSVHKDNNRSSSVMNGDSRLKRSLSRDEDLDRDRDPRRNSVSKGNANKRHNSGPDSTGGTPPAVAPTATTNSTHTITNGSANPEVPSVERVNRSMRLIKL